MKRKVKKMSSGGYGRFVEDSTVEDDGISRAIKETRPMANFGATDAEEYLKRSGLKDQESTGSTSVTKPERKKATPKAENEAQAERRMAAIGDKYKENKASSQSFPTSVGMESGSAAMKRGRASTDGSGSSPLDKYMRDKETRATRDKRKMDLAVERVKAGVGYKAGGSASSRADGIAQRGKTRGRIC